jgi:hypothetical protein
MAANLQQEFEFSNSGKRKTPKQKQFEKTNMSLLLKFKEHVAEAHQKLHRNIFTEFTPAAMDKNLPAVAMVSYLRLFMIRDFPQLCGYATPSRFKLKTVDSNWVYLKKLDERFRPQNIETDENERIIHQVTSDRSDKGANIFFGYTEANQYGEITGVFAVCIDGDEEVWRIDIIRLDNDNREEAKLEPIKPKSGGPKLKDGAKIRRAKRE